MNKQKKKLLFKAIDTAGPLVALELAQSWHAWLNETASFVGIDLAAGHDSVVAWSGGGEEIEIDSVSPSRVATSALKNRGDDDQNASLDHPLTDRVQVGPTGDRYEVRNDSVEPVQLDGDRSGDSLERQAPVPDSAPAAVDAVLPRRVRERLPGQRPESAAPPAPAKPAPALRKPTFEEIFDLLGRHPGLKAREICTRLEADRMCVSSKLSQLKMAGRVRSEPSDETYKGTVLYNWFLAGDFPPFPPLAPTAESHPHPTSPIEGEGPEAPAEHEQLPMPTNQQIREGLAIYPGLTARELAERLGVDHHAVTSRLANLKTKGSVRSEAEGNGLGPHRYYLINRSASEAPLRSGERVAAAKPATGEVVSPLARNSGTPPPPASRVPPSPRSGEGQNPMSNLRPMPRQDTAALIAAHIAEKGVTKCPTVALEAVGEVIPPEDRAAVRAHDEAMIEAGKSGYSRSTVKSRLNSGATRAVQASIAREAAGG